MKNLLTISIGNVFGSAKTNFLSLEKILGLKVHRGDNVLDSCFQYSIKDAVGRKLLNIKVYDKLLDLISRDGTHQVGSKTAIVLGS